MDTSGRRKFLFTCLTGLCGAAAAAVCWPVYRFLAPSGGGDTAAAVVIAEGEVAEGQAKFFQYAGSTGVLVRKKGRAEKQDFLCPCHGGLFSAEGAAVSGPPPKPLALIPFRVADGKITVGVQA